MAREEVGGPAEAVLEHWVAGELEVATCPRWRDELGEVLSRERFASAMGGGHLQEFSRAGGPVLVANRRPDYLLALAHDADGLLVTGDRHLLELAPARGVVTIRGLLDRLAVESRREPSGSRRRG